MAVRHTASRVPPALRPCLSRPLVIGLSVVTSLGLVPDSASRLPACRQASPMCLASSLSSPPLASCFSGGSLSQPYSPPICLHQVPRSSPPSQYSVFKVRPSASPCPSPPLYIHYIINAFLVKGFWEVFSNYFPAYLTRQRCPWSAMLRHRLVIKCQMLCEPLSIRPDTFCVVWRVLASPCQGGFYRSQRICYNNATL